VGTVQTPVGMSSTLVGTGKFFVGKSAKLYFFRIPLIRGFSSLREGWTRYPGIVQAGKTDND